MKMFDQITEHPLTRSASLWVKEQAHAVRVIGGSFLIDSGVMHNEGITTVKFIKYAISAICVPMLSAWVVASEIDEATLYGGFLTKAVQERQEIKLKKLPEYKEIKVYLAENQCPGFNYRAYIAGPEDKQFFYVIASKGRDVIIGRHFKAPVRGDSIDLAHMESSTNGCLNLGTPPSNVAALTATHLKPYPNEFHVLQSQLAGLALYIGTSSGIYAIEEGKIRVVESR